MDYTYFLRKFEISKVNWNFEQYLTEISKLKHRQAVTKLRISAHRLPIESGRYNDIPFDERIFVSIAIWMRLGMNKII